LKKKKRKKIGGLTVVKEAVDKGGVPLIGSNMERGPSYVSKMEADGGKWRL